MLQEEEDLGGGPHAIEVQLDADQLFRPSHTEQLLALRRALCDERSPAETRLARALSILEKSGGEPRTTGPATIGGLAPWQIRKVKVHIAENIDGQLRNDALAALARLTTSHFSRAFRNSIGVPPHEYVMQQRIDQAKTLMLSTDTPLGQIALECGLSDQAHLSRLFLRLVGESPRFWRKRRQDGVATSSTTIRASAGR